MGWMGGQHEEEDGDGVVGEGVWGGWEGVVGLADGGRRFRAGCDRAENRRLVYLTPRDLRRERETPDQGQL